MYMIILHSKRNNMKNNNPLIIYYICITTGILLLGVSIGTERRFLTALAFIIIIRSIILMIKYKKTLKNNKE
jgi:hypothetical protein